MTKEEAIKHLHTYSSTNGSGLTTQDQHEEAKKMAIKALETQLRWIPCSKKLPEPNRSVLVQLSDDFVDPIQIMTFNISKCEGDFFYFWRTQEMGINFDMDDIVAWMPLPEPWEGGQS